MKKLTILALACLLSGVFVPSAIQAQQISAIDSVMNHAKGNRLSVGGYGEVALTREFFSDNIYRYSKAGQYKNDPSHGRFDIPHAVVYLGYDFGKGWTMGSEIEFEHGGTGSAYEKEFEESGEWEQEVEKGGEVELEQFWLQKSFLNKKLNLRVGHIVVPVGLTNSAHEPTNFFTVYRPEGENTIFPCTWHQTGISLWGRAGAWKYEVQFLPGLDAMQFSRDNWIQKGAHSAFEFEVANKYATAVRIDNYSLPGLRIGVSGYYGNSIDNSYTRDSQGMARKLHGTVVIGSFDFNYHGHNWIVRGNFDYGHLGDAASIYSLPGRQTRTSPFNQDHVGKEAIATGAEAGWDCFSLIRSKHTADQKFYLFGRYEYYNSYTPANKLSEKNPFTKRHRMALGVNWYPIKQIVVKGEYSKRFLNKQYNNEPSLSIGIAYEGFFL